MSTPSHIDLIGENPMLHQVLVCAMQGGREFDITMLLTRSKWAVHFARKMGGEASLVHALDELVHRGFMESFVTNGGTKWWRYTEASVDEACVGTLMGCTEEDMKDAPVWLIDEMKRRGDLSSDGKRRLGNRLRP